MNLILTLRSTFKNSEAVEMSGERKVMEKRSDLNWKKIAEWLKRGKTRMKLGVAFCLIVLMRLSTETTWASEKVTIGAVENMTLLPWGVTIPARIDTGVATSSLDVCDLVVRQKSVYGSSTVLSILQGTVEITSTS